jgi:type I restriction enzyme S subunit
MKLADLNNPVRFSWLADQGLRLDSSPYLSGAFETLRLLERIPGTQPLNQLVRKPLGIFHAGRVTRHWVSDPSHGVPFLSSSDMLEADLSNLPLISRNAVDNNPRLLINRDWTLITRSGQIVGRVAYARSTMDKLACTEDVLRVAADDSKIQPGYLNAFLASRYGIPVVVNSKYGSSIPHLEPMHIADLPVPRFRREVEEEIHGCVQDAADLRAKFQAGVTAATRDLFESAGLPELNDFRWDCEPRDIGFMALGLTSTTLRALNLSPRMRRILDRLASVRHKTIGEICQSGYLGSGVRFARVDSDPKYGAKLIGQRQGFWLRPEGRWINPAMAPSDIFAKDESVLIASQGTLGENEVYCRAIFVTGSWLDYVYTQHFLRVVSGDDSFPGAYLFAFMRSEPVFRILRSMSVGSKQQDIHEVLRQQIPVPECTPADREQIAETVRAAYRARDEADELEDQAQELLDAAVRDAAGTDLRLYSHLS